jgi:hypothetical protein
MIAFIDEHRASHGIEPICRWLPIAPSTYHAAIARRADPLSAPPRVRCDIALRGEVRRIWEENFGVYRRPSNAPNGPAGDRSGKISENYDPRQDGALSARPGEPGLQGLGGQQALGL